MTRARLLDATIACVVEDGYAHTTTTKISRRAGVSRGAQVHHFATKSVLVSEAVAHLARRRTAELHAELSDELDDLPHGQARLERGLDLLWHSHSGPLFQAVLELWVGARTDPALRTPLLELERQMASGVGDAGHRVLGARGNGALLVVLSAMRGLAVLGMTRDETALDSLWAQLRRPLIDLLTIDQGAGEP